MGGFDTPRLFVDTGDPTAYEQYGLAVTTRRPTIRTAGNWLLAIWELYIRTPSATRFAIFQDDIVTCKNLKEYLSKCKYPKQGYWNLITYPKNQAKAPDHDGWFKSDQLGKGAQALVFSYDAIIALLTQPYILHRINNERKGHRCIDGTIVNSLKNAGWTEWCHNPSLVCHTGETSVMGNPKQPATESFRGEDVDALSFLGASYE
jgi:hypothetical protein